MKDDLRHNPDLDELFGIISKSAEKAVAADEKIKHNTSADDGWKERDKPDIREVLGDLSNAVNAKPEVDVTDASARKIGDAVAESVQKKSVGTTENLGNGTPETTHRDPRQRDEWGRFLPGAQKAPPEPGVGEKYGAKGGSWVGRGIGGVLGGMVGGYFGGPAGARVGTTMGAAIGGKVGGNVGGQTGAVADKLDAKILSPDSKGTLESVMPDAIQSVIRWYKELDKATENILRYNFQLSQASAEMGAVEAERDARETFRNKEVGDRLAWSAEYLSRSEQERKDNSKGLDVLARSVDNVAQGFKENIIGTLLKPLNTIAEGLNKILGIAETIEDKAMTPAEYMESAAARADANSKRMLEKQRSISDEMNRSAGRRFY